MKAGKITNLKETLDFDVQTVSCELDTSATRLRYFSLKDADGDLEIDGFNKTFDFIKNCENLVVSINDNTELYELRESYNIVVLYEDLTDKFIIFDVENKREIDRMINKMLKV